jgi:hypothetical protein
MNTSEIAIIWQSRLLSPPDHIYKPCRITPTVIEQTQRFLMPPNVRVSTPLAPLTITK